MERDEKGRFVKGKSGNPSTQFRGGVAEVMQARAVEKRRENKTLRETLVAALQEDGGGGLSKLEILVRKALYTHSKDITFKDLRDLSAVLGEDKIDVEMSFNNEEPPVIVFKNPDEDGEKE